MTIPVPALPIPPYVKPAPTPDKFVPVPIPDEEPAPNPELAPAPIPELAPGPPEPGLLANGFVELPLKSGFDEDGAFFSSCFLITGSLICGDSSRFGAVLGAGS